MALIVRDKNTDSQREDIAKLRRLLDRTVPILYWGYCTGLAMIYLINRKDGLLLRRFLGSQQLHEMDKSVPVLMIPVAVVILVILGFYVRAKIRATTGNDFILEPLVYQFKYFIPYIVLLAFIAICELYLGGLL